VNIGDERSLHEPAAPSGVLEPRQATDRYTRLVDALRVLWVADTLEFPDEFLCVLAEGPGGQVLVGFILGGQGRRPIS